MFTEGDFKGVFRLIGIVVAVVVVGAFCLGAIIF